MHHPHASSSSSFLPVFLLSPLSFLFSLCRPLFLLLYTWLISYCLRELALMAALSFHFCSSSYYSSSSSSSARPLPPPLSHLHANLPRFHPLRAPLLLRGRMRRFPSRCRLLRTVCCSLRCSFLLVVVVVVVVVTLSLVLVLVLCFFPLLLFALLYCRFLASMLRLPLSIR